MPFDVNENKTIYARTIGKNGEGADIVTEEKITKIDTKPPNISEQVTVGTEVTEENGKAGVKISLNAQDEESGIKYYQFSQTAGLDENSLGWIEITPETSIQTLTDFATNQGTWYLYVQDQAKNIANKSFEVDMKSFDNITPKITMDVDSNVWTQGPVTITIEYPEFTGLIKKYSRTGQNKRRRIRLY